MKQISSPISSASEVAQTKVSVAQKLAYGTGSISEGLVSVTLTSLATPVFVLTMGISPVIMSLAQVVFRLWDAFSDVAMGWISDNTRTRWGRRRPYIFIGAFFVGLWAPVLWYFNPAWPKEAIFAWMLVVWMIYYLFASIWNVPYQSLMLEMTPDSIERTNISAVRAYFGKGASLIGGWIWYSTQLPLFGGGSGGLAQINGARNVTILVGLAALVFGLIPAVFTREPFYGIASKQERVSIKNNFRYTFTNKPFLFLGLYTLLFAVGFNSIGGLGFFTKLFYVFHGDSKMTAVYGGIETTLTILTAMAGIPVFQWLAHKWGKKSALMAAMWVTLFASLSTYVTYIPSIPWLSMLSGICIAPATTGMWVLIPSMTGDVVDHDEILTGERREGAYASMYSWLLKVSLSIALGLSGFLVEFAGYDVNMHGGPSARILLSMRLMLIFIPAVLIGASMLALWRYPLTPTVIEANRRELERRRGSIESK
jgi:GPH family glycoside/pentoside/hexuronide:cation symporter